MKQCVGGGVHFDANNSGRFIGVLVLMSFCMQCCQISDFQLHPPKFQRHDYFLAMVHVPQ